MDPPRGERPPRPLDVRGRDVRLSEKRREPVESLDRDMPTTKPTTQRRRDPTRQKRDRWGLQPWTICEKLVTSRPSLPTIGDSECLRCRLGHFHACPAGGSASRLPAWRSAPCERTRGGVCAQPPDVRTRIDSWGPPALGPIWDGCEAGRILGHDLLHRQYRVRPRAMRSATSRLPFRG